MSEQLELFPLEEPLIVEDTSVTPNSVLCHMMNRFDRVFVIGQDEDGLLFAASDKDSHFWHYALDRAQDFVYRRIMED
jgi:hypothetical protein